MSRERASLGELLASEMVSRLEIMAKDVHFLAKKVTACSAQLACLLAVGSVCVSKRLSLVCFIAACYHIWSSSIHSVRNCA